MLDNAGFRIVTILMGMLFLTMGTCGALDKAGNEGWHGPSSKPGAASRPAPPRR